MAEETKKPSLAAAIICSVIGLFIFGIPLGIVAISIGVQLVNEKNNWGWLPIAIGAFDVIGAFVACVATM